MKRNPTIFLLWFLMSALMIPFSATLNHTENLGISGDFILSADPTIPNAPSLLNPDDSDNMYSRYKFYEIQVNSSDTDGDIDYVDLSIWDDTRATNYWSLRFNVTDGLFTEINGTSQIALSAYSSNSTDGNVLIAVFSFKIEWEADNIENVDTKQAVYDDTSGVVSAWAESDWDVEADLQLASANLISKTRGNLTETLVVLDATYSFYDSGGDNYPLDNETDFYIVRDSPSGYWQSSSYTEGTGVAQWSDITSGNAVATETYTIKAVLNDSAYSTISLMNTTYTDTYISDRLYVTLTPDIAEPLEDETVTITVDVVNDFDDSAVTNFNVTVHRDGVFWYNVTYANRTSMTDVGTASGVEHTYTIVYANGGTYNLESYSYTVLELLWATRGGGSNNDDTPPVTTTPTTTVSVPPEVLIFPVEYVLVAAGAIVALWWLKKRYEE